MEESADKKYDQRRDRTIVAHIDDWYVNMPHTPSMHRHIPCSPKRINIIGIPPIAIEIPVGKVQQFADQIQERMEC